MSGLLHGVNRNFHLCDGVAFRRLALTSGTQATAVEVDLLGNATRGRRVQQRVERPVDLQTVHRPAQQALAMEGRRHLPRHPFGVRPLATQMPGNRLADGPAMPP